MVTEISKMSPEDLEKVQSVIALFRLLGMTDSDIENLAAAAKAFPRIVETQNAIVRDQQAINAEISKLRQAKAASEAADGRKPPQAPVQEIDLAKLMGGGR